MSRVLHRMACAYLARKVDFTDEQTLLYVRCAYVGAQLLCLAVYYIVSVQVKRKNDVKVLKYVEPKSPMQQDPGALITTTNRDYDLSEVSKAVRGVLIGVAFMGFMHGYMKYTQPLFIQSIMALKGLYDSKIVKIHVLNKPAEGDLKRPFVAAPGFMNPAGNNSTAAAAPAVEAKKDK
ncbi:phosphate transporter (Pho88) [Microbotryomycetes sp. JL201]|nr:phosphate transporter (Pho88) [Microbotryomycetes sp. JL201]